MAEEEITLVNSAGPRPRYVRLARVGARLVLETWTGSAKRRVNEKVFGPRLGLPADHVASMELRSEAGRRMTSGFVLLRDRAEAGPGEVVLLCAAPNRSTSGAFDLSPDGDTLAVGTMLKGAFGAEIHLIDVRTGLHRRVHTVAHNPDPKSYDYQTFIHQVLFDADGHGIVYAVNGQTVHLDLDTGATRSLAHFTFIRGVDIFNAHWVRPSWDAARQRLLVFDADSRIRVLDPLGEPLLDLPARQASACRGGALSPSGRLLILHLPHDLEIWDVDTATLVRRLEFPFPPGQGSNTGPAHAGFDPTEQLVLTIAGSLDGPMAASIETGELVWGLTNPATVSGWEISWTWGYSPDGTVLAAGGVDHITLYGAADRQRLPTQPLRAPLGRLGRVAFSADGTLVAGGGDGGRLGVFAMPGLDCAQSPDRYYTEVTQARRPVSEQSPT